MKKYLLSIILCIVTGVLMGKIMFENYEIKSANIDEKIYYLNAGIFDTLEELQENTTKFENYIYEKKDNKYYVYLAITLDEEIKNKLLDYFKEYDLNVIEDYIDNEILINNLKEYDNLLKQDIEIKENIINGLKKYEEVLNDQN